MQSIPADLQQNIAVTLELTFTHNFWAILFFVGLCLSVIWSLYRPSRAATLAFVGFSLLLFAFEYTKHILEPLTVQTTNSLITMQEHNRVKRILDLSLVKLLPPGLNIMGILSLCGSLYLSAKNGYFKEVQKRVSRN
jgi:hypothetical protein